MAEVLSRVIDACVVVTSIEMTSYPNSNLLIGERINAWSKFLVADLGRDAVEVVHEISFASP